jgi:hypothetical protein
VSCVFCLCLQLSAVKLDKATGRDYRRAFFPGFVSGDRTTVENMEIKVWSDGAVVIDAIHRTGLCVNEDYVHVSVLFRDAAEKELAILPKPTKRRDQQGGPETEDEEWLGPPLTSHQSAPFHRDDNSHPASKVDGALFRELHSVQVYTRG